MGQLDFDENGEPRVFECPLCLSDDLPGHECLSDDEFASFVAHYEGLADL